MAVTEWLFPVTLVVMLIGLIGIALPVLPGILLIWIAGLVYAIVERFATFDPVSFVVFTVLGALGMASELLLTQAGAKVGGASTRAMVGGVIGGVVGLIIGFFVGGIGAVPGGLIGALVGVTVVEYMQHRNLTRAGRAAGGWMAGCLASKLVEVLIALTMIAIFVWQAGLRVN
jgi:uncharacterized protein YqgC (DUF456 family)